MKTPLSYQITESDCGTTSFLNAIRYVFNREEIPAKLAHAIMMYTLDNFGKKDGEAEGGTSIFSLEFLQHWINQYANFEKFPLKVRLLEKEEALFQVDKAKKLFQKNGCILASVWLMKDAHYVIITKTDKSFAYLFDPYYVDLRYFSKNPNIKVIKNMPFTYNRKVRLSQLFLKNNEDYSLITNNEFQELMIIERE
jgi:hypothetical protein